MKKILSLILIQCLFLTNAYAAGKIQGADVKSVAELVAAGATKAQLIDDSKIYLGANGINDTLGAAIVNGLIGGSGGSGGILVNPDFELPSIGASWVTTNGTPAINTTLTNVYSGKQSISITPTNTSSVLSVVQTVTTNAGLVGTQGVISIAMLVPSAQTNIQICPVVDTVEVSASCLSAVNNGVYRTYSIPFFYGSTSAALKIKSNGNSVSTTAYYADYAGMTLGQAGLGTITVDTDWVTDTANATTGMGTTTPANSQCKWKRSGDSIEELCFFAAGTLAFPNGIILPNSLAIDTAKILASNTTSGSGHIVGTWGSSQAANYFGYMVTATGTDTHKVYVGTGGSSSGILIPSNSTYPGVSNPSIGIYFKVPIAGWSSNSATFSAASANYSYVNGGAITATATTTSPVKGTVVTDRVFYQKNGQDMKAIYQYEQSTGGTNSTGNALFLIPNSLSLDSSIVNFCTSVDASLVTANPKCVIGKGHFSNGASNTANAWAIAYDATHFRILLFVGTNQFLGGGTGLAFSGNLGFEMDVDAPISGWSNISAVTATIAGYNNTAGVTAPKIFSASVTTTSGAITNQLGSNITSCTAANPTVCTLSGLSAAPNCGATVTGNTLATISASAISSTSISFTSTTATTGLALASQVFNVLCQGQ